MMGSVRSVLFGATLCFTLIRIANAASAIKSVALPPADGTIVGAAFSPDSSRIALIRNVVAAGISGQRHVLQIVDLGSGQEIAHADILSGEAASLASRPHFVRYSPDGRYLLLATNGSDVLQILDGASLRAVRRFALHPEAEARVPLGGQDHHYFRGVVSLAVASKTDFFAALTHDEMQGNEIFVGSFSSGQVAKNWSLGQSRAATELGQISISLNEDGSRIAVSMLPDGNSLPKTFNNLRIYDSSTGQIVKAIRTNGLIGQVSFMSREDVLTSRIDTPGVFSKKTCLQKWNINTGKLDGLFCDKGHDVNVALAVSQSAGRVVGFASRMHKSIEGQIYAASGRVDVWNLESGNLIASSSEMSRLVSYLQVSPSGEWIMADQTLLQFSPAP